MNNLRKNKYFLAYLATWGVLMILGSLVSDGGDPYTMVLTSAVLALVVPLLILVCDKVGADAPKGKHYTVHSMEDGSVVCRVEDMWIYRGEEDKAAWYIQGRKVYSFTEKGYLYRMERDGIYRRGEKQPCMTVARDTVYRLPDNTPLYQIAEKEAPEPKTEE